MMDLNYIQTPLRNQTIEEQIKDFICLIIKKEHISMFLEWLWQQKN